MKLRPWHCLIRPEKWPAQACKVPRFQRHRGAHLNTGHIENSLPAIQEAYRQGTEMCEIDVRLSKDQVPVVFHDDDFSRLFNQKARVEELSYEEMRRIGPVISLEQLLKEKETPPLFNVELKSKLVSDPLCVNVAEVVRKTKSEFRIIFSSFNPFAIFQLQRLLPEVPRALLVTQINHELNRWWIKEMTMAPLLKLHFLNLDESMLTESVLDFWNRQKMPLAAWTVNDENRVSELLDQGVSSVISDLNLP
jgi:glycerophosphoryl diester phosphodiesterase